MTTQKSLIIYLGLILSSCSTIKTIDYFKLTESKIETYNGYFIKNANDTTYKMYEQLFGSVSKSDTVIDKTEIIYKTIDIDGHKAFYAIETADTLQQNPNVSTNHFLFSSLIFFNDAILIAPVDKMTDLKKLKFSDFKYKIPSTITYKDNIQIIDRSKKIELCNFGKNTIQIDNNEYKDCLNFDVKEIWSDTTYIGHVWLHPKIGLLKWIRSTGRIETRML